VTVLRRRDKGFTSPSDFHEFRFRAKECLEVRPSDALDKSGPRIMQPASKCPVRISSSLSHF
jgi:hypothetical protein